MKNLESTVRKNGGIMTKTLYAFILIVVLIGLASGQPVAEPSGDQLTSGQPVAEPSGDQLTSGQPVAEPSRDQLIMMAIFVLLLLIFAAAPIILNMYWAYRHLSRAQNILNDLVKNQKENKIENSLLIQIVRDCIDAEPSGIIGVGRSTMALTLTVIVGISIIYLLVYNISAEGPIKDLLLTVIGAISSIIGFYFGGRALQESPSYPSTTSSGVAPTEVNIKPYVTDLAPDKLSPQVAGTTINWIATAIDPDGDQIFYKFLLKGPSTNNQLVAKTQGWIKEGTWDWVTTPGDIGLNLIEVRVRDGKHADEEGYDSRMIVSYQVIAESQ